MKQMSYLSSLRPLELASMYPKSKVVTLNCTNFKRFFRLHQYPGSHPLMPSASVVSETTALII